MSMNHVSVQAGNNDWVELKGKFLIHGSPSRVILYLEGPPPGTDILVNTLDVKHARRNRPSPPPFYEVCALTINNALKLAIARFVVWIVSQINDEIRMHLYYDWSGSKAIYARYFGFGYNK